MGGGRDIFIRKTLKKQLQIFTLRLFFSVSMKIFYGGKELVFRTPAP
jgi:hypothetical protein